MIELREVDAKINPDVMNKCKRRKIISSNLQLERYLEYEPLNHNQRTHLKILQKYLGKDLAEWKRYRGTCDIEYDDFNELEKAGLNETKKKKRVIYSIENNMRDIIEDIYNVECKDNSLSYDLLSGNLDLNFLSLKDLGIIEVTTKLSKFFSQGQQSRQYSAWGSYFDLEDVNNPEDRGLLLLILLIVRRAHYYNELIYSKVYDYYRTKDVSFVPCSVGLSNSIFLCDNTDEFESVSFETYHGRKIIISPIVIEKGVQYVKCLQ